MSDVGYGNGLPPELLQLLLPYLSDGAGTDSALGMQAKSTNNVQDLIQLLFSPNFAITTGTYDPMLAAGQAPAPFVDSTPLIDRYMNSGNTVIANVAAGMASGQYDPTSAYQVLIQASDEGTLTGFTPEQLFGIVDEMKTELVKNDAARLESQQMAAAPNPNDPYTKAGLPSPLEEYQTGYDEQGQFYSNAPLSTQTQMGLTEGARRDRVAQEQLAAYQKQNPDYLAPGARQTVQAEVAPLGTAAQFARAQFSEQQGGVQSPTEINEFVRGYEESGRAYPGMPKSSAELRRQLETGQLTPESVDSRLKYDKGNDLFERYRDLFKAESASAKETARWASMAQGHNAMQMSKSRSGDNRRGDQLHRDAYLGGQQKQVAEGRASGEALAMRDQGRTPMTDQLQSRLSMLRAMGLI